MHHTMHVLDAPVLNSLGSSALASSYECTSLVVAEWWT